MEKEISINEKDKLDIYLLDLLKFLEECKDPNRGVVAAGIIDEDRVVYSTSYMHNGWSIHAERGVVREYINRYGYYPSLDASLVVTLSPCINFSRRRFGLSCSELVTGKDCEYPGLRFKNIHVGCLDSLQVDSLDTYTGFGINLFLSKNPYVVDTCNKLFEYFTKENYGKDIPEYLEGVFDL